MQNILGFSAWFHDSSACLVQDGQVVSFAEEERFSRWKHSPEYPKLAIDYCLSQAGLTLKDLDAVVYTGNPIKLVKSSLSAVIKYFPQSLGLFDKSSTGFPIQKRYKNLFSGRSIVQSSHGAFNGGVQPSFKYVNLDHYKCHLGAAFFGSPFEEAAILEMDFATEGLTQSISVGSGLDIKTLVAHQWPHAWGAVYLALTRFLGFRHFDEYKVMGMAAYGKPKYFDFFDKEIYKLDLESGRFRLDMDYFGFHHTGLRKPWGKKLEEKLGLPRDPQSPLTEREYDIAASLQLATEMYGIKLAKIARKMTGLKKLALAGGVVQNCLMNQRIAEAEIFEKVFPQPLCGDAGASLGAALYYSHAVLRQPRTEGTKHLYLGPEFSEQIPKALAEYGLKYQVLQEPEKQVAAEIADGKIIGFYNGRMEAGPRALGGRSILADPRRPDMKDILNLRVKHREHFRPFAPSVLEEDINDYFEEMPRILNMGFMITTANVKAEKRAEIPAITHQDGTARPQAVSKVTNPRFWNVINEFKKLTGIPVVINTSFNDNEPIVCTPKDAIECFLRTKIDLLVLENHLIYRDQNLHLLREKS